ncbi:phage virion morphogenesis protein (plasmid) [Halobacteriovorax sp. GFR7]|uniref:phage virion morphogenesis protein n=1 Tax=unclassified Halobacteriovorax TaxID=2639665 RepID=UPI003D957A8B
MLDFEADFRSATRLLVKVNKQLDADKVADDAVAIILSRIRKRFLNQTAPDGSRWPISKAAIMREETGRGGGTLYDSGDLFRSIQAVKRGRGIRAIQTDKDYAIKHHRGLDGMVARPFLDTNDGDLQFVTDFIISRVK